MNIKIFDYKIIIPALLALCSCSQEHETEVPKDARDTPMTFSVSYPEQTRVAGSSFENNDKIGLFVVEQGKPFEIGGNLVNNEALTFNGTQWSASQTLFWDNGTFNAYGYYPYTKTVSSIEDLPFSVQTDQRTTNVVNGINGFEASDFLFAKTEGLAASNEPIHLNFKHIMSKLSITLVKGDDFEGELPTDAKVYIHSTYPEATIDLNAGVATVNGRTSRTTIIAKQDGDYNFSAVIVPQRIANRMPLIEVEMKGVAYLFESTFLFKPGINHNVRLIIEENPEQIKIEIGGELQNWQKQTVKNEREF